MIVHRLVERIWERGKFTEPPSFPRSETRYAINQLCRLTGLTHKDLASFCNVTAPYFRSIEARNSSISPEVCDLLQRVALDYDLPYLSTWFKQHGAMRLSKKRAERQKPWS